ncbi:hypothetical protein [Mycolicibacterium sphagni]|uniref:Uncharacterized protein n=1 Tax=Mycolicibacterium sphagni TaxID=1786 RepID=A0A255DHL7_9MYCO|nr:hypothetical protein [Mycolicibacterium sphagni]OYN78898.1 hypothetical protein CG716_13600 [Mycolicibacterium sphagni]
MVDEPFADGMELPEFRANTGVWPEATKAKWDAWRSMPHARLWTASEWSFALDSLELAAEYHRTGETRFATELRNREKVLGTTLDYRRALRIRYIKPAAVTPSGVADMMDYRDL